MPVRRRSDAGQAFPIYITVVAGLLFLAFAYLAVGQGAVNRNGAQTAADAAALAAAQDGRAQLAGRWVEDLLDLTRWQEILLGNVGPEKDSCWRASELAQQNDAKLTGCGYEGLLGYSVTVEATKPVGDSIVPGTEDIYASAKAIAVIEPLCTFDPPGAGAGDDVLPQLTCEGGVTWDPDPDDRDGLPKPEDLFDVHLAND